MKNSVNIGIIGDYDAEKVSHQATNQAIRHAATCLGIEAKITWLPTPSFLKKQGQEGLEGNDAFWASPGSPYLSMEGAIRGIQL